MTRADIRRIFFAAVIIFLIGVVFGMILADLTPRPQAAHMNSAPESGNRARIEGGAMPCMNEPTETEEAEKTAESEATEPEPLPPLYTVDGYTLPAYLQDYLREELRTAGIEWFMPHAICQIYGESRGDLYAQNPNGQDKGILQYRLQFWPAVSAKYGVPYTDIYNAFAQFHVYAQQQAERFNRGESLDAVISLHYTSEYGAYDAAYVAYIRGYERTLREVAR